MPGISKAILIVMMMASLVSFVSAVRINEVMAQGKEFVEIYNEDNQILNLSEWRISKINSSYHEDKIVCWNIENCSIITNSSYFIIIGNKTIITELTNLSLRYYYTDGAYLANHINDNGDNITFFNLTFSTSFSYNSSYEDKSWQLYNSTWQACTPTPGQENYCSQQTQNSTQPPATNTTQTSTLQNQTHATIKIQMDFDSEAESDGELDVGVSLFNLKEKTYDVKVFIEYEGKMISEIENDGWKSGAYYLKEVFTGPGEATENFNLRLNKNYRNFSGEAKLYARVRESGSSKYYETNDMIEFIEKEVKSVSNGESVKTSAAQEENKNRLDLINNSVAGNVLRLNSLNSKDIKSYNSTSQKIKELSFIGFILFCLIIFLIVIKNGREHKSNSDI